MILREGLPFEAEGVFFLMGVLLQEGMTFEAEGVSLWVSVALKPGEERGD